MKQRITYLLRNREGVDPSTLEVTGSSLQIPGIDAVKEWRTTIGVKELPPGIWDVLQHSHELHLRWSSTEPNSAVSPLLARTSPGLHAFYTPLQHSNVDAVCPLLGDVFGHEVSCHSVKDSFTAPPILSERFAMSSAHQYYAPLFDLRHFVKFIQLNACSPGEISCFEQIAAVNRASSIDIDFDAISHAVTITVVWSRGPDGGLWNEVIRQRANDRIEVGILNSETPTEPEELSLGGFLTVLGEDDKPSATLFSFPSRHHAQECSSYRTSFRQPTGLHPTLEMTFPVSSLIPPAESCSLHTYLTLPKTLFIDRYQLSDALFLASQNLIALRTLSGETDLEAPAWVLRKWGSAALLELTVPEDSRQLSSNSEWIVSIPLHARYLSPSNTSTDGRVETPLAWPVVFWACEAEEGLKMAVNPFDRVNLGYDGLFGPKTMFYHVEPKGRELVEWLSVPVLNMEKTGYVELGTAVVVFLGFAWICWKMFVGAKGRETQAMDEKKKL